HGLPSTPAPVQEKGYDVLGRSICALGAVAIIFNFSGCRGSDGFYSIKNELKDLEIVSNYIWQLPQVDRSRIGFLAFSAGTIPTIYFIAKRENSLKIRPKLVIIGACPADLSGVKLSELRVGISLANQLGNIRLQKGYENIILTELEEFMPIKWIKLISIPKYIVHGAKDRLIDVKNAYKLYEHATDPKKLIILEAADHQLRQDADAMQKILSIIKNKL
ncbi:MAG: alpha/beta hydrolase, partial [Candidatus Helarchaeota archaeon]|nr:alpha/beta hydrolase [Candidatus Helarchaeota archaeon]